MKISEWWDQPDKIDTFEPISIDNGIDMVFSGHNHIFEVRENDGVYSKNVKARDLGVEIITEEQFIQITRE